MKLPVTRLERTMKNGLRVVLLYKPDFARSLFMLGIPAGGSTLLETDGKRIMHRRSGLAHYLEHQMFRLHGQDVTPALADVQARTNAFTSYDETCYFVYTNSAPWKPLELLIDFVQTLDIDTASVDKEKGIILAEYQQYDQEPESRLFSETLRSLYHHHPMREEILGTPEDIAAITVDDLKSFYDLWYDPAQMVLVGISSQDPEKLFQFIEEQEARYPSRFEGNQRPQRLFEKEPDGVFRENHRLFMDVDLSYACLGVKLDPIDDVCTAIRRDWMLNLYLSSQFSSLNPDYQNWIDTRLIGGSMGAEADLRPDHGYVLIYAQSDRPEEFLQTMRKVLDDRKPMCRSAFDSLLRREKASAIRMADQYESLASQTVSGCFAGYDPLDDLALLESLRYEEICGWIDSMDLSRLCETIVSPLAEEKEHNA